MDRHLAIIVVVCATILSIAFGIWPTPYTYERVRTQWPTPSGPFVQERVYQINRLTGESAEVAASVVATP